MKLSSLSLSALLLLYSSSCEAFSVPGSSIFSSQPSSTRLYAAEADAKWKIKKTDSSDGEDGPKMMDVDKEKTRTQRIMEKTPLEGQ